MTHKTNLIFSVISKGIGHSLPLASSLSVKITHVSMPRPVCGSDMPHPAHVALIGISGGLNLNFFQSFPSFNSGSSLKIFLSTPIFSYYKSEAVKLMLMKDAI